MRLLVVGPLGPLQGPLWVWHSGKEETFAAATKGDDLRAAPERDSRMRQFEYMYSLTI